MRWECPFKLYLYFQVTMQNQLLCLCVQEEYYFCPLFNLYLAFFTSFPLCRQSLNCQFSLSLATTAPLWAVCNLIPQWAESLYCLSRQILQWIESEWSVQKAVEAHNRRKRHSSLIRYIITFLILACFIHLCKVSWKYSAYINTLMGTCKFMELLSSLLFSVQECAWLFSELPPKWMEKAGQARPPL